jgi:hypothetical protein
MYICHTYVHVYVCVCVCVCALYTHSTMITHTHTHTNTHTHTHTQHNDAEGRGAAQLSVKATSWEADGGRQVHPSRLDVYSFNSQHSSRFGPDNARKELKKRAV